VVSINKTRKPDASIIFAGNKIDMRDEYRKQNKYKKSASIEADQPNNLFKKYKCKYLECSCLTKVRLK